MGRDTDFNFGFNEAENLDPPWSHSDGGASAGTERRTAQQASAVPAFSQSVGYNGFAASLANDLQVDAFLKGVSTRLNSFREEIRQMAKAPSPNRAAVSNGRAPAPEQAGGGDFAPWLKVNELIKTKTLKIGQKFKMQVMEAREAGGNNFSDVIVDVKIGGKMYAWGLKADKKAYAALYDQFGDRLDRWKGTVNCLLAEPYKKGYNPSIEVL